MTIQEASWDAALDKMAREIKRIQATYGRDTFAIVSTGQILTEGFYTLGKLARGVIGTNNYDGNTTCAWLRPYRATSARSAPMARPDATKISSNRLPDRLGLQSAGTTSDYLLALERSAWKKAASR